MATSLLNKLPHPSVPLLNVDGINLHRVWYDFIRAIADEAIISTVAEAIVLTGSADEIQLDIKGFTTQTNPLMRYRDSANNVLLSLDNSGNVTVNGTVDGRDLAVDGVKLDGIEVAADVTDEVNVKAALDGASIPAAIATVSDKVLIQDVDDQDNFRHETIEDIFKLGRDESILTIATGAITVTDRFHRVATEGAAASDDLDTINGGHTGMMLVLTADDSANTVVCKDGTGNLALAGDFSLDNSQDTIQLVYSGTDSVWKEVARSNNGA